MNMNDLPIAHNTVNIKQFPNIAALLENAQFAHELKTYMEEVATLKQPTTSTASTASTTSKKSVQFPTVVTNAGKSTKVHKSQPASFAPVKSFDDYMKEIVEVSDESDSEEQFLLPVINSKPITTPTTPTTPTSHTVSQFKPQSGNQQHVHQQQPFQCIYPEASVYESESEESDNESEEDSFAVPFTSVTKATVSAPIVPVSHNRPPKTSVPKTSVPRPVVVDTEVRDTTASNVVQPASIHMDVVSTFTNTKVNKGKKKLVNATMTHCVDRATKKAYCVVRAGSTLGALADHMTQKRYKRLYDRRLLEVQKGNIVFSDNQYRCICDLFFEVDTERPVRTSTVLEVTMIDVATFVYGGLPSNFGRDYWKSS